MEVQYTARAGEALVTAFGTPEGKAFGLIVGAPAAIGVVMADTAVKSTNVDVVDYRSPSSSAICQMKLFYKSVVILALLNKL